MSQKIPALNPAPFDRCHDPIHVDAQGHVVADPFALLCLDPTAPLTEEDIREAWTREIQAHPPEQEPEHARALREARDRLLSPDRLFERSFGALLVPDPEKCSLPDAHAVAKTLDAVPDPQTLGLLTSRDRLLGQAVLYALVEDLLNS